MRSGARFASLRRGSALAVACALHAAGPTAAEATWSIVAVDPATGEVGIAGASCIDGAETIAGVVPGRGAIAAQAMSNVAARDRGEELLAAGASPQAVIDEITSDAFDPRGFLSLTSGARVRQYGVAALGFESAPASYTGTGTFAWAGSAQAAGVSVQGNLLAGPEVVANALARFEEVRADCGSLLHDQLLAALEAGAAAGGDRRCERDLAALSAFLVVASPDDPADSPSARFVVTEPFEPDTSVFTFLKQLMVPEKGGPERNPVTKLRQRYDAWRVDHAPVGRCGTGEE